MANNKIVYNGNTLIDLTGDDVKASDVAQGKIFHLASGEQSMGTALTGLTILSYGSSTWNDFITAYNNNSIVYCRASSNSNPASGSQTRLAFMAYVSNETTPTSVEFQYVRSMTAHTDAQQTDQVFVYKLTNANGGTWSVETRNIGSKIVAGTNMTSSYSNGTLTLNASGGGGSETLILSVSAYEPGYYDDEQVATVDGYNNISDILDAMPNVVARWELSEYIYNIFTPIQYQYTGQNDTILFECNLNGCIYTLRYDPGEDEWYLNMPRPDSYLPYEDWDFELDDGQGGLLTVTKRVFCVDIT